MWRKRQIYYVLFLKWIKHIPKTLTVLLDDSPHVVGVAINERIE